MSKFITHLLYMSIYKAVNALTNVLLILCRKFIQITEEYMCTYIHSFTHTQTHTILYTNTNTPHLAAWRIWDTPEVVHRSVKSVVIVVSRNSRQFIFKCKSGEWRECRCAEFASNKWWWDDDGRTILSRWAPFLILHTIFSLHPDKHILCIYFPHFN